MSGPLLLDLYCGAGGAAMGYHRAGFTVVGVDHRPQARYPFRFVQADSLDYLERHGAEFDVIHGSPPCQRYSAMSTVHGQRDRHPDLVGPTRDAMLATGRPWVIENVPRAPLIDPVVLCGSMFGLGATVRGGEWRQLRRHRLFESNTALTPPVPCAHSGPVIGVYGGGPDRAARRPGGSARRGYTGNRDEAAQAIGAPWMSRRELAQAIPPAYTEHIGRQLLAVLG